MRVVLLIVALSSASPALAQQPEARGFSPLVQSEPKLEIGKSDFALPVVEYRAPDGTIKISQGIFIGRDISPNARVGLGLFKVKPKYDEDSGLPTGSRSRKVALGIALKF